MKYKIKKEQWYFIILWIFLITSFVFVAAFLVMEANGYRFNLQALRIEKTGMIILEGESQTAQIYLNGGKKKETLPTRFSKLLPGRYEVVIKKEGYLTWSKIFQVRGGEVEEASSIILFLAESKIEEEKTVSIEEITREFKSLSKNLEIKGNEIWQKEKLITRFSEPVLGAIPTRDRQHIIFQISQDLRAIELDGSNNTFLVKILQKEPTVFVFRGDKLYFIDDNKVYSAMIK